MLTLTEVVKLFDKPKKIGTNKYQVICPCHDDQKQSLSIGVGNDGRILLHCHANCSTDDILGRVGLSMSDLMPERDDVPKWRYWLQKSAEKKGKKLIDTYDYFLPDGGYAFTRVRYDPKEFFYFHFPDETHERLKMGLPFKDGKKLSRKDFPSAAFYGPSQEEFKKAVAAGEMVFYAEGEKDVRSLAKHCLPAVTAGAVQDAAYLSPGVFQGASVVVVLADNDKPGKISATDLCNRLTKKKIPCKLLVPCTDKAGGDVADYLQTHAQQDLLELARDTPQFAIGDSSRVQATAQEEPATEMTDAFKEQFHLYSKTGKPYDAHDFNVCEYLKKHEKLIVVNETLYIYQNGYYINDVGSKIVKDKIKRLLFSEIIKEPVLQRICRLLISDHSLEINPNDVNAYPVEWIPFKNGFYDPVKKELIKPRPENLATVMIPHRYNPEEKPKGEFLEAWLKNAIPSDDDREMILEFAGLCLTRDIRQQKFLLLVGQPGTGKSSLIYLIKAMVGEDNTASVQLDDLSKRFSTFNLYGKLLDACGDIRPQIDEPSVFKQITGDADLIGEQKGKDCFTFRNMAKLLFSSNDGLPTIKGDTAGACYRRFLVAMMPLKQTQESKDTKLTDKLMKEMPYFLSLCVDALGRLYERGVILESQNTKTAIRSIETFNNPVTGFLEDCIEHEPGARTKASDVFKAFEEYCEENGLISFTNQTFYKTMYNKGFPTIQSNGKKFTNIKLKTK